MRLEMVWKKKKDTKIGEGTDLKLVGRYECLLWMLEQGADVKFKRDNGDTCLSFAAHNGHLNCVKLIIERGGDVNAVNK